MRIYCRAQGALLSALWRPKWGGNVKSRDICTHITDSLCCAAANSTVKHLYFPIKINLKNLYLHKNQSINQRVMKTFEGQNVIITICINPHHCNFTPCHFILLTYSNMVSIFPWKIVGKWKECQYKYCIH